MLKRIVIGLVVLVVIVAIVYAEVTATTPVETAVAETGRIRTYIDERAKTTLPHTYRLSMPLSGRILPIQVAEGDRVKKGSVVARLDPADLDTTAAAARARTEAIEARIRIQKLRALEDLTLHEYARIIESINAVIDAADERIKASRARLKYSDWWLVATEESFKTKAVDENTLKRARMEQASAMVDLTTDQLISRAISAFKAAMEIYPKYLKEWLVLKDRQQEVMDQELSEARTTLERVRRDRARADLESPVDGVVLTRHVANECVLPAGAPLLDIGRLEDLEVTVEVLTREVVAARVGNTVEIHGPAIGAAPIRGRVKRIEPEAFTKVSSLGVEQQRVNVVIALDPRDLKRLNEAGHPLGVGFRVRVRVFTAEKAQVVRIPRAALFRGRRSGWRVFKIENGKSVRADVEVGLMNDRYAEIVSGLASGDRVIVAPDPALEIGTRVAWEEDEGAGIRDKG